MHHHKYWAVLTIMSFSCVDGAYDVPLESEVATHASRTLDTWVPISRQTAWRAGQLVFGHDVCDAQNACASSIRPVLEGRRVELMIEMADRLMLIRSTLGQDGFADAASLLRPLAPIVDYDEPNYAGPVTTGEPSPHEGFDENAYIEVDGVPVDPRDLVIWITNVGFEIRSLDGALRLKYGFLPNSHCPDQSPAAFDDLCAQTATIYARWAPATLEMPAHSWPQRLGI